MNRNRKIIIISSYLWWLPAIAFAQTGGSFPFKNLVLQLGDVVFILVRVAFAAALLFFFWGLAKYILSAGDEAAKASGKNIMIWGVIALFVMASIWGIVVLLRSIFGVSGTTQITVPTYR